MTMTNKAGNDECGRNQAVSYADLMKPDEDWRNLSNAAERRKIQNRLAQRAYRRNMRDRTKEVERLKKQLQKLQEGQEMSQVVTPPPEYNTIPEFHARLTQERINTVRASSMELPSSPMATPPDWMEDYPMLWPPEQDQFGNLELTDTPIKSPSFGGFPPQNFVGCCHTKHAGFIPSEPNIQSDTMSQSTSLTYGSMSPNLVVTGPNYQRRQPSESCSLMKSQLVVLSQGQMSSIPNCSPFTLRSNADSATSFHTDPSLTQSGACPSPTYPLPANSTFGKTNNSWSPASYDLRSRHESACHHCSCHASTSRPDMAPRASSIHHLDASLLRALGCGNLDTSRLVLQQLDGMTINSGDDLAERLAAVTGNRRAHVVAVLLDYGLDAHGH